MKNLITRTPLLPFNSHESSHSQIFLKPENLQLLGSYKMRGIVNVINEANPAHLAHGLSAASAGNMAQAVAHVAKKLNIPCKIYLPDTAPNVKREMILQLAAEIIELPYQAVWDIVAGRQLSPDDGTLFIHPAYNPSLLRGYSSIAHEIIQDMPDLDAIIIPFGVGGLSIGVGTAIRELKPDVAIYTSEPETAAPLKRSLANGQASSVQRLPSFIDAIGTPEVLPGVYQTLAPIIKDSLVVSINEIKSALSRLLMNNKLLCEGAGACSAAAAIKLAELGNYKKIVAILSGGNLSPIVLKEVLI